MTTTSAPLKSPRCSHPRRPALGYDFALLGLPAREARIAVIREAALATSARIRSAASDVTEHHVMLADLVTSTYRLLDPRKRVRMLERVQLCLLGEEELELQAGSRIPFFAPPPALVPATLVETETEPSLAPVAEPAKTSATRAPSRLGESPRTNKRELHACLDERRAGHKRAQRGSLDRIEATGIVAHAAAGGQIPATPRSPSVRAISRLNLGALILLGGGALMLAILIAV